MKNILFFDTETVGLPGDMEQPYTNHHNWPECVSIAWILYREDGMTLNIGNYIVAPRTGVENEAMHINGITPEIQADEGTEIYLILEELLKDFQAANLVICHNVAFDQNVIFAELDRLGYAIPQATWYCTKKESVELCCIPNTSGRYPGNYKWPSLDELHQFLFNEKIAGRENIHSALIDVQACARCYFEIQRRAAGPKDHTIATIL